MQDLSTIKGWWDNNSRENLSFDDGTKVSLKRVLDKNGNATQMLEIISAVVANNVKFNETKFQNENIKTLFEMFKQRENLNGLNSGLNDENLHLNSHSNLTNSSENLAKNSNLQTKLNLINSNANLSKTNSKDSLLKALLNSVSNDEKSPTKLSV